MSNEKLIKVSRASQMAQQACCQAWNLNSVFGIHTIRTHINTHTERDRDTQREKQRQTETKRLNKQMLKKKWISCFQGSLPGQPHCSPALRSYWPERTERGDVFLCYCCNKTSVLYTTACQPCLQASMRASKKRCDAKIKKSFV